MLNTVRELKSATSVLLYTQVVLHFYFCSALAKPTFSGQLLQWCTLQSLREKHSQPSCTSLDGSTSTSVLAKQNAASQLGLDIEEPSQGVKILAYRTEQQPQINQI